MASAERGVELTRLSSGVRLEVERKTASADFRSVLVGMLSASALAAVREQSMVTSWWNSTISQTYHVVDRMARVATYT